MNIFKDRKIKEKIRNSNSDGSLFIKFFKKPLNSKAIRTIFYEKKPFAYSNYSEKKRIIGYLNDNCVDEINTILSYADEILHKKVTIFEKEHVFDDEINWHYSYFNDFVWKLTKSEDLNIHPKDVIVDVKYVWELNRHQYFTYLGFAYYYTGEEKYARAFKSLILDWIEKNPALIGINWYSGLEISLRLVSWIFSLYFFKESKEINNDLFFKQVFNSMFQHAYYLNSFYTRRKFNHTVGDLFGIYLFSKIFEELAPIKKWENKFFKKLNKQILLQVRIDGTNIEQSVNYHRFVLEFFTMFLILNPEQINKRNREIIEKMYDYLLYIIKPNGEFPLIGDSDDGKLLLLTFYEKNSFLDLLYLGSMIFNRPELKYVTKKIKCSGVLLLGISYCKKHDNLLSNKPKTVFKLFEKAGYFSIRQDWTEKSNYCFVDFGRFGPYIAAHTHSNISNIIYIYRGNDILIDSGTYTYNKDLRERDRFRGSKAHNVLTIDGKNQARAIQYFGWKDKPKIKRITKERDDEYELSCYHDGYPGFVTSRKVILKKDLTQILIKDTVLPSINVPDNESSVVNIYYHFNKELSLKLEENKLFIDDNLIMEVSSDQDLELKLERGFFSPQYGFKTEINMLNVSFKHDFKVKNAIWVKSEIKLFK